MPPNPHKTAPPSPCQPACSYFPEGAPVPCLRAPGLPLTVLQALYLTLGARYDDCRCFAAHDLSVSTSAMLGTHTTVREKAVVILGCPHLRSSLSRISSCAALTISLAWFQAFARFTPHPRELPLPSRADGGLLCSPVSAIRPRQLNRLWGPFNRPKSVELYILRAAPRMSSSGRLGPRRNETQKDALLK